MSPPGGYDAGLSRERTYFAWERTVLIALSLGAVAVRMTWPVHAVTAALGVVGLLLLVGVSLGATARRQRATPAMLAGAAALWCLAALLEVALSA